MLERDDRGCSFELRVIMPGHMAISMVEGRGMCMAIWRYSVDKSEVLDVRRLPTKDPTPHTRS